MTEVLIAIPCLNEKDHIETLVHKLVVANQNRLTRIAIVDGGSSDGTFEIAKNLAQKYSNVTVLENKKRIQAAAINLAVSTFCDETDYFIRIDAHADYPSDYCYKLVDEAKETGADSVVVSMETEGKTWFQKAVAAAQNSLLGNGGAAHRNVGSGGMWVDHGHHALMRIKSFRDVGGYDETFSHNEDAELDTRMLKAGFKIWLTDKTSLVYYPRSAVGPLFRQYMKFGQGRAQNILKHKAKPKLRQLAPAAVLPAAIAALLFPHSTIMTLPIIIWVVFCLLHGLLLGSRANDMRIAAAGPIAMIMHAGWSFGFWKSILEHFWRRN